jgi:hypothetical protein
MLAKDGATATICPFFIATSPVNAGDPNVESSGGSVRVGCVFVSRKSKASLYVNQI